MYSILFTSVSLFAKNFLLPKSRDLIIKMMAIENCIQSIKIIECRLSKVSSKSDEKSRIKEVSSIDCPMTFTSKMKCHYQHLLAEAYYNIYLHILKSNNGTSIKFPYDESTCSSRCLNYGENCLSNATEILPAVSSLRLLCAYSYCKYISSIFNQYENAIALGTATFNEACLHTNQLEDEAALKILQKIRDEFMNIDSLRSKLTRAHLRTDHLRPYESSAFTQPTKDFTIPSKKVDGSRVASHRDNKGVIALEPLVIGDVSDVGKGMEIVKRLSKIVSLAVPVIFETLTSSNAIFKALDQIFRVFIRGNALPGQQSGGNFVDMDGRTVSFRSFVLNGPFMSWKGFVNVMMQFGVARVPASNTPTGRSYNKSVQAHVPLGFSKGGADQPIAGGDMSQQGGGLVDMVDAAALFIECSRSVAPLLVLTKYATVYADIAEGLAAEREKDPWQVVADWANISERSSQKWEISAGLNFMQFIDCLGKCGVLAYSGARFREILPSHSEKVEHFFSAYLGLSDTRKWFMKVDARLKFIKNLTGRLGKKGEDGLSSVGSDTKQKLNDGSSSTSKPRAASAGRR